MRILLLINRGTNKNIGVPLSTKDVVFKISEIICTEPINHHVS